MTTVLIMAGGTGGHVFPALAVARVLRERSCRVVWLGTRLGIEARLVPAAGIPVEWVRVEGLRGKSIASWLAAPFRLLRALGDALGAVRRSRPDVVLGLGGFVAGPGCLAARALRRPLVIHEQNAVAGFTNRILARFADTVAEAFPGSFGADVAAVPVGNPLRREIEALTARAPASHGRTTARPAGVRRQPGRGGAQPSCRRRSRSCRPTSARGAAPDRPRTSRAGRDRLRGGRRSADVREFIDDMAAAYGWADLAVCRSGR